MSELCRAEVVDRDGVSVGNVNDVRLVQDGPLLEAFGNALRVDGLIAGNGAIVTRLGFHRHKIRGPWIMKAIALRVERKATFIPWSAVDSYDSQHVRLNVLKKDLPTVADIYQ